MTGGTSEMVLSYISKSGDRVNQYQQADGVCIAAGYVARRAFEYGIYVHCFTG